MASVKALRIRPLDGLKILWFKSRVLSLPGRKARLQSQMNYEVVWVDATQTPIQRPKKQRRFYSGKKKRHTLKTQLVIDKVSQKVICTSFIHAKRHDFHLFKQSSVRFQASTQRLTDSGYQGLQKIHTNSQRPKKKPRKRPLTKQERRAKKIIASQRVLNENVMGRLKRFKIISDKYRNRQKRFGLRFNLIASIYNFEWVKWALERTLLLSHVRKPNATSLSYAMK